MGHRQILIFYATAPSKSLILAELLVNADNVAMALKDSTLLFLIDLDIESIRVIRYI